MKFQLDPFSLSGFSLVQNSTVISGGSSTSSGGGGGTGIVQTIVAGANVTVDATDPANPIVASTSSASLWKELVGDYTALSQTTPAEALFLTGGANAATEVPYNVSGLTPNYNFTTDNGTGNGALNIIGLSAHGDGGFLNLGPLLFFNVGGGSVASPTAIANGTNLGGMVAGGYDGTGYSLFFNGFFMQVDGAVSPGVVPIRSDLTVANVGTLETWRADGRHYLNNNNGSNWAFYHKLGDNVVGIAVPATYTPLNQLNIGQPQTDVATVEYLIGATANGAAGYTTVAVQGYPAQNANLFEWQDSTSAILARIDSAGNASAKGYSQNIKTVTTDSVLNNDSVILVDASGANKTETLPTAIGIQGRTYTIKKTDSSANTVTLATTSAQTIDGSTTVVISVSNVAITVISDNQNWYII